MINKPFKFNSLKSINTTNYYDKDYIFILKFAIETNRKRGGKIFANFSSLKVF